jgi:hypothetical protein
MKKMIFVHPVQPKFDLFLKERDFFNSLLKSFLQSDTKVTRNYPSTTNLIFYHFPESLSMTKRLNDLSPNCFPTLISISKGTNPLTDLSPWCFSTLVSILKGANP